MKKIIKPAEREEAVYFSDFSGKSLGEFTPPVELKLDFNYGSEKDGANLLLHLNDEDVQPILDLIKKRLSIDTKQQLKKILESKEAGFNDSMQFRDWDSCDTLSNSIWFLRELLDIREDC